MYSFNRDGTGTATTGDIGSLAASAIATDGQNLFVATATGTLTARKLSDLSVINTATISGVLDSLIFDGRNIWVGSSAGNFLEKR